MSSSLQPRVASTHEPAAAPRADDAQLIERSQAGDVQAFNLLVERYQHRVYAVCFRMLGDADAADATQEVFLSAFNSIRRYRGGSFIAWLLRIATNECYDQLRVRKRRPHVSLDAETDPGEARAYEVADPGEAPEDRILRAELSHRIQHELRALPADQRLVIVLSDIEGYSYAEIVAATGWAMGTVKSRLGRGRARLRDALRAQDILPA